MNPLEELLQRIRDNLEGLDAAARDLAEAVARDAAELAMRSVQGEDVDGEIAHVRAQALNLSVAARQVVQDTLLEWVADRVGKILEGALGS